MANEHTVATTEPAHGSAPAQHEPNLLAPEIQVLILTWVTFFIILAILSKFAWKPILAALDKREEHIRQSLEEADKTRAQYAQLSQRCEQMLAEADEKAKLIVTHSRQAAQEAARVIEEKAKSEAQILLENANREIKAQTEKAQAQLREESVRLAINLAGKLIDENLDSKKNQELMEKQLHSLKLN